MLIQLWNPGNLRKRYHFIYLSNSYYHQYFSAVVTIAAEAMRCNKTQTPNRLHKYIDEVHRETGIYLERIKLVMIRSQKYSQIISLAVKILPIYLCMKIRIH